MFIMLYTAGSGFRVYEWNPSLRSKRFRRAFRRFEAFFASWTRENWGERKKVREGLPSPSPLLLSVLHSPQLLRRRKAKNASKGRKTLRKRLLRRVVKSWNVTIQMKSTEQFFAVVLSIFYDAVPRTQLV